MRQTALIRLRRLLSRRPAVVLLMAAGWGQVKTVALLALGAWCAGRMPAWALWVLGTAIGQGITYCCYVSMTWAEERIKHVAADNSAQP